MPFELVEEVRQNARIKVIGLGGGGCNAVNTMMEAGLGGVEFFVMNTDLQSLGRTRVPNKIPIGSHLTKGLGCGADPEKGRQAAEESADAIVQALDGADMVFITAGLGGGTGTGSAPLVAAKAREMGILTVGVVTKPFQFEGARRSRHAEEGLRELRKAVDTLITIPNQRLMGIVDRKTSFLDSFKMVDAILLQAVQGISDLVNVTGIINVDFADVRTVMANGGRAVMGTGVARGENRAVEAAQKAISSPLLEDGSIDGARGVLINISGGADAGIMEINEASSIIQKAAHEDAQIIFGAVMNDREDESLTVTVIATGFDEAGARAMVTDEDELVGAGVALPFRRDREWPAYLRKKAVGAEPFMPELSLDQEDLDVPTFLRRQTD